MPLSVPTPGMAPTVTETLAFAVCAGVFQLTTPMLVTTVPFAAVGEITARNRSTAEAPGASAPYEPE